MREQGNSAHLTLAACLLFLTISAVPQNDAFLPAEQGFETPQKAETIHRQRYINQDYGYYVALPEGVVATSPAPPSPNHGVLIDASNPQTRRESYAQTESYISVQAHYQEDPSQNWRDIQEREIELRKNGRTDVNVVSRADMKLQTLDALHLVLSYKDQRRNREMIDEAIIGFLPGKTEEVGTVYTLDLVCPKAEYERNRPFFEAISRGFRLSK